MATTPTEEVSLEEMLLDRVERETDPEEKAEIMRRLQLSQFMDARYSELDSFLEQIRLNARDRSKKQGSPMPDQQMLDELSECFILIRVCKSQFAMGKLQEQAGKVLGRIISSIWAADAELKCKD